MTSFVFYDTETTGTDTVFNRILQFAAILTDENMRELDRFEIRCRLLPHVVPAAGALIATRVSPLLLTDSALPTHYRRRVRSQGNWRMVPIDLPRLQLNVVRRGASEADVLPDAPTHLRHQHEWKYARRYSQPCECNMVVAPTALIIPIGARRANSQVGCVGASERVCRFQRP